jgi:hypothetical protein
LPPGRISPRVDSRPALCLPAAPPARQRHRLDDELQVLNVARIAAMTSVSVTTSAPVTRVRLIENVSSPGVATGKASQIDASRRCARGDRWRTIVRDHRSPASTVSRAVRLTDPSASAHPAVRPPPPQFTSSARLRTLRGNLRRDLSDRVLPGDDVAITATRHDDGAGSRREVAANLLAILAPAIVKNDARPEPLRSRSSCAHRPA